MSKSVFNNLETNNSWIREFLLNKSGVDEQDEVVQKVAKGILSSQVLSELVRERYSEGVRFVGWTTNGSRGNTDSETGDIMIGKGTHAEILTLGYECMNSRNQPIYRNIAIKYANLPRNDEMRKAFAQEFIALEAQAMYVKCTLATETGDRSSLKDHYLEVFDDERLEENEKITKLAQVIREKGTVYSGKKSAYEFYQHERYDRFMEQYNNAEFG